MLWRASSCVYILLHTILYIYISQTGLSTVDASTVGLYATVDHLNLLGIYILYISVHDGTNSPSSYYSYIHIMRESVCVCMYLVLPATLYSSFPHSLPPSLSPSLTSQSWCVASSAMCLWWWIGQTVSIEHTSSVDTAAGKGILATDIGEKLNDNKRDTTVLFHHP